MSGRTFDAVTPGASTTAGERDWPVETVVATAALVPVTAATALSVARNAPVALPGPVRAVVPAVSVLAAVAPGLALVALAATVDRRGTRVALLAAGVFPVLAAAGDAAWYPAAAALVAGGAVAVGRPLFDRGLPVGPTAVAALGLSGLVASLLGAAGVATPALRPAGATAAFATLAALAVARSLDTGALALWVATALAVAWGVTSAPFVAGAVTLVAFGAGSVPLVLLALGVGGAVAVAAAALWGRRPAVAAGTLLLLAAGAPASIPRASAVVLGLVVLVDCWAPPTGGGAGA